MILLCAEGESFFKLHIAPLNAPYPYAPSKQIRITVSLCHTQGNDDHFCPRERHVACEGRRLDLLGTRVFMWIGEYW